MSALTGNTISSTYQSLLKVANNATISADLQNISDGLGNATPLYLSTDTVQIAGTLLATASYAVTASYTETTLTAISASYVDTASYAETASYALNIPFLRSRTHEDSTDVIREYESIFNPFNLTVLSTSIFIVDQDAQYYILGDLINSGSLVVSGTLHIDGGIYNSGSIVGPGIIE